MASWSEKSSLCSRSAERAPRGAAGRAHLTVKRLALVYPARSEIEFRSLFQLLVAVVLSAQSTDRMANQLARDLLMRYPEPAALAAADQTDVERILRPIGFFRTKSRSLIASSNMLVDRYGGQVPSTMGGLLSLPGVGRKTANAILGVGFGVPAVTTDRHLIRVALRVRLISDADPESVEKHLEKLLSRPEWTPFSLRMTLHGRYTCVARRPLCERCILNDFCPSSTTAGWPMTRRRRLTRSLATLGHIPQLSQTSPPSTEHALDLEAAHADGGQTHGGTR